MAIATANGASKLSPQMRSIPGAPQKANGGSQKKKKSPVRDLTNGNGESIDKAAHAAALTDKAPSLEKVDESVKVKTADVAEQAEHQAALEAVKIIEQNGGHAEEGKSVLVNTINKRIKVLNKKLQRAISYSELSEDKLNADMRRIIASKGNLEGAVSELSEVLKAIELNEKEQVKHQKLERSSTIAKATETLKEENSKKIKTLFQLMHLHSLVNASMQAQFAPPPMPTILHDATSEHIAAIGKLYAELSASNEVSSADVKSTLLDKLVSSSSDSIVGKVTFKDVCRIIEGLSNSTVQQSAPDSLTKESVTEPETPSILFMQASEIEHASGEQQNEVSKLMDDEVPSEVKQAEPEGEAGTVDGVSSQTIERSASSKGEQDGCEAISEKNQVSLQVGPAKAAVEEPVEPTEIAKIASGAATPSTYKIIDWSAHDDDDFGDLEMQPEPSKITAPLKPVQVESSQGASSSNRNREKTNNQSRQGSNQQREHSKQHQKGKNQQQNPQPVPKLAPQVDEDGFTVASSKRTKMLMQQQAANASRGGRGGNNGGRPGQRNSNQGQNGFNGANRNGSKSVSGATSGRGRGRGKGDNGNSGDQFE